MQHHANTRLARSLASVRAASRSGYHKTSRVQLRLYPSVCALGLDGIVSERKDSRYNSGRSLHWVTTKKPNAPAVKREAEEDWGSRR
jgi:ATP-dependent DNA ligase